MRQTNIKILANYELIIDTLQVIILANIAYLTMQDSFGDPDEASMIKTGKLYVL